ncbi:hypothetical protein NQ317_019891 [Molorchus minor]|uniref:Uncharacterized protein n=1 Tax=Molorchus minor TaxID=1323400 RepID=A0ABQ9IQQ1_9CUCU|nr:hypothetical protein NQ317_019891 [Molorchus minor]
MSERVSELTQSVQDSYSNMTRMPLIWQKFYPRFYHTGQLSRKRDIRSSPVLNETLDETETLSRIC